MNVLIVKLSSLGDVVHAMAAVQDIRRAYPQAQIDWVVEGNFAPLVRRCGGVNRVIEADIRRWRKSLLMQKTRVELRAFRKYLGQVAYDAVLDLQGLAKSALVSRLARLAPGGKRYALGNQTEGSSFEAPTRWVADVAIKMEPHIHAVQRSRVLCAQALGYALPDSQSFGLIAHVDRPQAAIKSLATPAAARLPVVALLHGTSRTDKLWPVQNWIALGTRLNASGVMVALPHSDEVERRRSQEIASRLNAASVWLRMSLDALVDEMALCVGAIGVDSGLSHIAVALDLPHVQIYNFDTAWRTGPHVFDANGQGAAESAEQDFPHQLSVFAQPTPTVDAVWQAWQRCVGDQARARAQAQRVPAWTL